MRACPIFCGFDLVRFKGEFAHVRMNNDEPLLSQQDAIRQTKVLDFTLFAPRPRPQITNADGQRLECF
jgi:hypothetical protein